MLEVFFCNVGDGDAILIREFREGLPEYTVFVDCGRPFLEPAEGSLRKEAICYLKARGIDHIDRIILTHLHIDHIGGTMRILNAIGTDRIDAAYLPPEDAEWITPSFTSVDKTQNGLCHMLNIFLDIVNDAHARGVRTERVRAGNEMLTDRLSVAPILARREILDRQRRVFDALYRGEPVDPDERYRAAKQRNLSSLMLRFTYAGRSVLITGDRYAADWEDEASDPCDVLKVPHHGDPKSMTEALLPKLSPQIAVISCQNDPFAKKDRPNAQIVELLQSRVPQVLCTENKPLPTLAASTHNGIRVTIADDGAIACETE